MSTAPKTSLILGTAGHIDHGKSSLVKALTGVDPDRLAEEKKRGITIELGFAQLALPSGRRTRSSCVTWWRAPPASTWRSS
mgnify:CR=1 FL=1